MLIPKKTCIALWAVGLASILFFEGDATPRLLTSPMTDAGTLRVITFNAQFLPLELLNKRADGEYRAAEVSSRLLGYDIVGLNEIFHPARRREVLNCFQQAWGKDFYCVKPNSEDRSPFGLDSGLILLSRLPIIESHSLMFGNDSTFRERGILNDGFARKGALHARVQRSDANGEILIDCFLTHLESKDPARRSEQYTKVAAFIREHSRADLPILLLGDFNTFGDQADIDNSDSAYHHMFTELSTARGNWFDLGMMTNRAQWGTRDSGKPNGGERIDYIFLSNPTTEPGLQPAESRALSFPDSKVGYLSDHCAVEAIFNFASY